MPEEVGITEIFSPRGISNFGRFIDDPIGGGVGISNIDGGASGGKFKSNGGVGGVKVISVNVNPSRLGEKSPLPE